MNINKAVDKAYETKSLKEILNAPIDALEGISPEGGKKLLEVLKVKTVKDLATNKFVLWAQGIEALAEVEE